MSVKQGLMGVPYIGAIQNVNLGEYGLNTGFIKLDNSPTNIPNEVGVLSWNDVDGTADLKLKGGNVTLQLGQELVKRIVNKSGANLLESQYKVVKIVGATGQRLSIDLALANSDLNSATTLGVVTENIDNNQEGFITYSGEVHEINTTGSLQGETWLDGDILYLSPINLGGLTNIKPVAPNHTIIIGYVEYSHSNHGKIFIKVDNGYELEELHDVLPTPYINKGILYRDTNLNLWKSNTIYVITNYIPAMIVTTIERNALTAVKGMQVYDSDLNIMCHYNGTSWRKLLDTTI